MVWLVVGMGVVLGVWLCWCIFVVWNVDGYFVLLGMLVVNWIGVGVIGFLVVCFEQYLVLVLEWWLFVVIGVLGGLIMFLIFLVEFMILLQWGDYLWVIGYLGLYLLGFVVFCVVGFVSYCVLVG